MKKIVGNFIKVVLMIPVVGACLAIAWPGLIIIRLLPWLFDDEIESFVVFSCAMSANLIYIFAVVFYLAFKG